eukprot:gb/GECG01002224.1/.p1 GENE.gb/GECG01002224.1/~~gb/GECG01002224.1/.p1  ORF type:complete len:1118 (+),score=146.23 gb/GECG01002224.1/:1-3354(+)
MGSHSIAASEAIDYLLRASISDAGNTSQRDDVIEHAVRQAQVSSQASVVPFVYHAAASVYDRAGEAYKLRQCLLRGLEEEKRFMLGQLQKKSKRFQQQKMPELGTINEACQGLNNEFGVWEYQESLVKERILQEYGEGESKEEEGSMRMYKVMKEIVELLRAIEDMDFKKSEGPQNLRYWFYVPSDATIAHLVDAQVQHQRFFFVHHQSFLFSDVATCLFHHYLNDVELERETYEFIQTLTLEMFCLSLRHTLHAFSKAPQKKGVGLRSEIAGETKWKSGQFEKPTVQELNTIKNQKTAMMYSLAVTLTNICNMCVETGTPEISRFSGKICLKLINSWSKEYNVPRSFMKLERYVRNFMEEARSVAAAASTPYSSPFVDTSRATPQNNGYYSPIKSKSSSTLQKEKSQNGEQGSPSGKKDRYKRHADISAQTSSLYMEAASPSVSPLAATPGAKHFLEPIRQANDKATANNGRITGESTISQVAVGWYHHPKVSRVTPLILTWQREERDMTIDSFRTITNPHSFIQSHSNCAVALFASTTLPPVSPRNPPNENGTRGRDTTTGLQCSLQHSRSQSFLELGTAHSKKGYLKPLASEESSYAERKQSSIVSKHLPLSAQRSWQSRRTQYTSQSPYFDESAQKEIKWKKRRKNVLLENKFARLTAKKPEDLASTASTNYDEYGDYFPDVISSLFPDTERHEPLEDTVNYIDPKAAEELRYKLFYEDFERPTSTKSYSYSPEAETGVSRHKSTTSPSHRLGTAVGKLKSKGAAQFEHQRECVAKLKRFFRCAFVKLRIRKWEETKNGVILLQRLFKEKRQQGWPEYFTCDELRTELKSLPDGEIYSREVNVGDSLSKGRCVTERVRAENQVLQVTWDDVAGDEHYNVPTRICLDHRRRDEESRRRKCLYILRSLFHVESVDPETGQLTESSISHAEAMHYGIRSFNELMQNAIVRFNNTYMENKRKHYEALVVRIQSMVRGWIERAKTNALAPAYRMLDQLPKGTLLEVTINRPSDQHEIYCEVQYYHQILDTPYVRRAEDVAYFPAFQISVTDKTADCRLFTIDGLTIQYLEAGRVPKLGYQVDPQVSDEDSFFWESTYAPFYSDVLKQASEEYRRQMNM